MTSEWTGHSDMAIKASIVTFDCAVIHCLVIFPLSTIQTLTCGLGVTDISMIIVINTITLVVSLTPVDYCPPVLALALFQDGDHSALSSYWDLLTTSTSGRVGLLKLSLWARGWTAVAWLVVKKPRHLKKRYININTAATARLMTTLVTIV
jgi:hypothetical protein